MVLGRTGLGPKFWLGRQVGARDFFPGLLFGHAGLLGLPLDDFHAGGLDVPLVSIFFNPMLPLNAALALVAQ